MDPTKQPRFGNDFLLKGTCFRHTFSLRVHVFNAFLVPHPANQPANQPASRPSRMCSPVGWAGNVSESVRFRIKINTILAGNYFGISPVPSLPNLGPRPPRICIADLASTIIGPDINAKCTDVKFLIQHPPQIQHPPPIQHPPS